MQVFSEREEVRDFALGCHGTVFGQNCSIFRQESAYKKQPRAPESTFGIGRTARRTHFWGCFGASFLKKWAIFGLHWRMTFECKGPGEEVLGYCWIQTK